MNKYVTYVCDIDDSYNQREILIANSQNQAEEKLMERLCDRYDWDNPYDYDEFIKMADNYNVIIGDIIDIEEI